MAARHERRGAVARRRPVLDALDAAVRADEDLVVLAALRHVGARDRQVRVARRVQLDQRPVVERVDLVAGQHEHVARARRLDEVAVLIDGIDGAAVPALAVLLLGGPDLDELAELAVQKAPAGVHVADQRLGLVLGQQGDAADLGVDAVRQHEIDDAVLPAEWHRGLGLPGREPFERPTPAVGEDRARARLRNLFPAARRPARSMAPPRNLQKTGVGLQGL